MNDKIKLIAVDLDGTLLNSDHQINPKTETALKRAMGLGVMVVIATGKTRHASGHIIQQLGLNSPGVYSQGLTIANPDGSVRKITHLDPEISVQLTDFVLDQDFSFVAYRDMDVFTHRIDEKNDILPQFDEPASQLRPDRASLLAEGPFQKFIIFDEQSVLDPLQDELTERFAGVADLVRSQTTMLELVPAGTSKGGGLKWVLDDLGISPGEVIAFGDGENDLEMLELVRIGIAMGNAMPRLKKVADVVTLTNDQDGIAVALDEFLFS